MEVTIHFSEQDGRQVLQLPDRDAFVSQAVARALKECAVAPSPEPDAGASKWARMVERERQNPTKLGDYYQQFRKDMREFREGFHFKHDEVP